MALIDRRKLLLACAGLGLVACASAQITRYQSPAWSGYTDKIAILPLLVVPGNDATAGYTPEWIREVRPEVVLTKEDVEAAHAVIVKELRVALPEHSFVLPSEVDKAMTGKDAGPMRAGVAAGLSAQRTKSQVALVFSLQDYKTQTAGGAQSSATAGASLYGPKGKVVWSLSAPYTLKGSAGKAPPLVDFISDAIGFLTPEIEEMLTE